MPCSNLRFLIVEDHPFQRQMLARLLTTLGSPMVCEAEDGNAAVEVLTDAKRPVDIVVCDLAMPGMDGLAFVRHLSESCDPVSLIVASAVDRSLLASVANMARAYGVNLLGVIGKPVTAVKLTPLLDKHRSGTQQARAEPDSLLFSADELALAWDRDEFQPWFEPIVHLATGKVAGISAVPRWVHPEKGPLAPSLFTPSLQARGLANALGWRMLQKSAAQCKAWHAAGHPLTLAVTIEFQSLTAPGFAAQVEETIAGEHLDPSLVTLMIREAALHVELPNALENLARLRMKGFGLGIDDFGDGLMATDQLALVAFTHLKMKSSLVNDGDGGVDLPAIAVALDLAARLKIASTATGVDSRARCDMLRGWGCVFIQGPYAAAPMPAEAVLPWLAQWKPS